MKNATELSHFHLVSYSAGEASRTSEYTRIAMEVLREIFSKFFLFLGIWVIPTG